MQTAPASGGARRLPPRASGGGSELVYTYDTHGDDRHRRPARDLAKPGIEFKDLQTQQSSLEDIFVNLVRVMNLHAIRAIYMFEMARASHADAEHRLAGDLDLAVLRGVRRGDRVADPEIDGVSYAAFIIPGLMMLSLLTQSISNASFGIYMPRFAGTIYEVLSAPVSYVEIIVGYVGAAASKSIILGIIILATARLFVSLYVAHPVWMVLSSC